MYILQNHRYFRLILRLVMGMRASGVIQDFIHRHLFFVRILFRRRIT